MDNISAEEKTLYDLMMTTFLSISMEIVPEQFLIYVNGAGGSGESYIAKLLSAHLADKAKEHYLPNPILRTALTGVAVNGICGRTLHPLLRLPIDVKGFHLLSSAGLNATQADFSGIYFLWY